MNTNITRPKRRYRKQLDNRFRRLLLESLEDRRLLASDWQNAFTARDVNVDKVVSPVDALVAINELNQRHIIPSTTGELPDRSDHIGAPLYDVNGDGFLSPLDVLIVINAINEDFIAPQVTAGLQFDSAPGGAADNDGISFVGTITGTAIDNLTGIKRVEYAINGGAFQTVDFERDGSFSIQPALAEGEHTIVVRAVDGKDFTGEAESLQFTFDSEAPEVVFNNPGPHITRSDLLITGQVTDALAGVESLLAQVDLADTVAVPVAADGTFAFTASLPTDSTADGQHLVRFRATDKAGNLSTLKTVDWKLDTRRPVITTNADAVERTALTAIELSFSEDIAAAAFTAANYTLTRTSGPNAPAQVPIFSIQQSMRGTHNSSCLQRWATSTTGWTCFRPLPILPAIRL
ncbi:MAG: dockerin type I domain-containing protein [Planctomycetota bacterium]|nr:dockerin type I domain-containing protein [Planctomycetota bacterium]